MFFWNVCTHGADQVAAQRYLSTPSASAARRSVWVFSVLNVSCILLLMLDGLALFYFDFHQSDLGLAQFQVAIAPKADKVLPQFIAGQLSGGPAGLMLAALLAASMSSLSSAVNSISAVVVNDFVRRLGDPDRPTSHLALAKVLSAIAGLLGIGLALIVDQVMRQTQWNLIEMIERLNHLFVAPLGALFFTAILLRRVGTPAALLGFFAGVVVSFLVSFSKGLFGMREGISFMWIMPASFLVSMVVSYMSSFLFAPPTEAQLSCLHGNGDGLRGPRP
jgi:SSS family solute:Na+ symporter